MGSCQGGGRWGRLEQESAPHGRAREQREGEMEATSAQGFLARRNPIPLALCGRALTPPASACRSGWQHCLLSFPPCPGPWRNAHQLSPSSQASAPFLS